MGKRRLGTWAIAISLLLLTSPGLQLAEGQPPVSEIVVATGDFIPVLVDDADNDGIKEIVAGDRTARTVSFYVFDGSTYVLERTLAFAEDLKALAVGDTDGDGRKELVVGTSNGDDGGYVYVGEVTGGTFSQEWKSGLIQSFHRSTPVSVGDGDGDGLTEIAVAVSHYGRYLVVYEFNGTGYSLAWQDPIGSDADSAYYADTDGDGTDELLVATGCYSDYGIRVYDASTLTFLDSGVGRMQVTGGDVDGDGVAEVVAGVGTKCGGATTPLPYLQIYEYTDGAYSAVSASPIVQGHPGLVAVTTGELMGGGAEEIAYGTHTNPGVTGVYQWNGSTWDSLWSYPQGAVGTMWIGDADNDGSNELVASQDSELKVFDGWGQTDTSIRIYTDRTSYSADEAMQVGLDMTTAGPTMSEQCALDSYVLIIMLRTPSAAAVVANVPLRLPSGWSYSNPDLFSWPLPALASGTYTWIGMLVPVGEEAAVDYAFWEFSGQASGQRVVSIKKALRSLRNVDLDLGE